MEDRHHADRRTQDHPAGEEEEEEPNDDCLRNADFSSSQVEGRNGLPLLRAKIGERGPLVLYHGALAAASATAVGHFPWFFVFNLLQEKIPVPTADPAMKLGRNAIIGFCSSIVSDSCSNSLRVIKTTRQTFAHNISYWDVVRHVVKADGYLGLMGRGLKTRLMANGMQGLMFSVLYKYFVEMQENRRKMRED